MAKAYSYLRFSTPRQIDREKIRQQLEMAREYCARNDLELDENFSFSDLGVSAYKGTNKTRGLLSLFLYAVQNQIVKPDSYFLIESLDRLSRESARKALKTLEELIDQGITVVTLSDNQAFTAKRLDEEPTALLFSIAIFIRANEESVIKAERIRQSWTRKIEKARRGEKVIIAPMVPAWLKIKNNKIVVNEEKAELVRKIFRYAKTGMGATSIATKLNNQNLPSLHRAERWQSSLVLSILNNPAVIGDYTPRKMHYHEGKKVFEKQEPVKDYYPKIISKSTWTIVKKIREKRRDKFKPEWENRSTTVKNIFAFLAKCPKCGGSMRRKVRSIVPGLQTSALSYLSCVNSENGGSCPHHPVLYPPLERAFLKNGKRMMGEELNRVQGSSSRFEARDKERERLLLKAKVSDVCEEMTKQDFDPAKINSTLRNLFEKVVIDYAKGEMEFIWAYGGNSRLSFFEENREYVKEVIAAFEITPSSEDMSSVPLKVLS